ncbi:MAG: hypothetical protein IKY62_05090, partial [Clostridia bacterium]|nr:hypothetical protein [Clostridia bacterium]
MKRRFVAILLLVAVLSSLVGCVPKSENGNAYPVEDYRTTMQYYDDFKILQLADLHLGIETDVARQLEIVRGRIEAEKPDLIILTGDNFMYASREVVNALVST